MSRSVSHISDIWFLAGYLMIVVIISAKIAWKRAVTGVREMCDVCDTTLFNMHWVCHKCGFVVCLDCYKVRLRSLQQQDTGEGEEGEGDPYIAPQQEDQRDWLTCSANRQQHEPDKLMLTQIIPGDALWEVGKLIHDMARKWSVPSRCACVQSNSKLVQQKNGLNQVKPQATNPPLWRGYIFYQHSLFEGISSQSAMYNWQSLWYIYHNVVTWGMDYLSKYCYDMVKERPGVVKILF